MFREKRGDDHADAVVHPAGLPKLPHAGIDDGVAGLAALPGAESLLRGGPRKPVERIIEILLGQSRKMKQQVVAKLAPGEFAAQLGDVVGLGLRPYAVEPRQDLIGCNLTMYEVRG
jgi:hypothetical protein